MKNEYTFFVVRSEWRKLQKVFTWTREISFMSFWGYKSLCVIFKFEWSIREKNHSNFSKTQTTLKVIDEKEW